MPNFGEKKGRGFLFAAILTQTKKARKQRKKQLLLKETTAFVCWRKPIFPGRHQPSIFGTSELNFRVRNGNGWTLVVINTNFVTASSDSFNIIPYPFANCNPFLKIFSSFFIRTFPAGKKSVPAVRSPQGLPRPQKVRPPIGLPQTGEQKNSRPVGRLLQCWRKPIFPGRHQPSIFGTSELNFRVRNGNGWTLVVINTNYSFFVVSSATSIYYHRERQNASTFLKKSTESCKTTRYRNPIRDTT